MKRLSLFFVAVVIFSTVGCMKKRRIGTSDLQSNSSSPSDRDSICPGGVNVFIRPVQSQSSIMAGQRVKFEILASGCLYGYGVSVEGRFLPFNPGIQVDLTMPQTPEPARTEEFSIVAFDSSGTVHRGPYQFDSIPFNVSAGSTVNLNFLPSQTISVEEKTVTFFINASEPISIQRIYSEEAGYIITPPPTPFTLSAGEWRQLTLQLSRGNGGSLGGVKFDYSVNGVTRTAQLTVNHNICMASFEDDFLGIGRTQALTYRCADGLIRLPLNLSEQLVSSWSVPTGYSLKDIMHGRIDSDNKADLLFFATKTNEPRKGYFFYGRSQASTAANSTGGSFNVVQCSGHWEAPSSTVIPNQFNLEARSGGVSAKIYTIQNGGVRYQSLLSVGDNSCSLGTVQLAPSSTFVSVSQEEADPGENFSVTWSAANITGFKCRLQKKLVRETAWTLVGEDNLPASGSTVVERTETEAITASTQYRAICTKTENGGVTTVGENLVRTVEVKACQMQASGATSSEITADSKKYRVLTFSQVGDHSLSVSGNCNDTSVLVVAGGGGAGSGRAAGGGGGGGVLYSANFNFPSNGAYTVTVGAGGSPRTQGQNSSVSNLLVAIGGGRGGNGEGWGSKEGGSGGSGGGGGFKGGWGAGAGTSGQGHNGGNNRWGNWIAGGGGGGAGGGGHGGHGNNRGSGGPGGPGRAFTIRGATEYFGGGGGGRGQHDASSGGAGGGGSGGREASGTAGAPGTGGGGGGSDGPGGSGIVIIRYELP